MFPHLLILNKDPSESEGIPGVTVSPFLTFILYKLIIISLGFSIKLSTFE